LIRTQTSKISSTEFSTDETQDEHYAEKLLGPEELIRWLDMLEINLGQGDYAEVTEQIYTMRTMLYENYTDKRAEEL
jgi:hypothetical protein